MDLNKLVFFSNTVAKLEELAKEPKFKAIFEGLADRKYSTTSTDLYALKRHFNKSRFPKLSLHDQHNLKSMEYKTLLKFFESLKEIELGKLEPLKSAPRKLRFTMGEESKFGLKELGLFAVGRGGEAKKIDVATLMAQEKTHKKSSPSAKKNVTTHAFKLRPDFVVSFSLPSDLTKDEVLILASFVTSKVKAG